MKPTRWLTHSNPLLSHLRIAIAGALFIAAAGIAFVAANTSTSSPPLLGKSDGKGEAKREARFARSEAAPRRFQTLLGPLRVKNAEGSAVDGAAQEDYDNRAYPSRWISTTQTQMAA